MKLWSDPALHSALFGWFLVLVNGYFLHAELTNESCERTVVAALFLIRTISSIALYLEATRRPFSLHGMHLLFIFVYFGSAASLQYQNHRFPMIWNMPIGDSEVLRACVLVILWLVVYILGAILSARHRPQPLPLLERCVSIRGVNFMLPLCAVCFAVLYSLGLFGAFTRGTFAEAYHSQESTRSQLILMLTRGMPIVVLVALIRENLESGVPVNRRVFEFGFIAGGVFLFANPLAGARYWLGMCIIAILVSTVLRDRVSSSSDFPPTRIKKSGAWLYGSLVAGLIVIMPLVNRGRAATTVDAYSQTSLSAVDLEENFQTGDAESLSALMRAAHYTLDWGQQENGRQLLGALFGWVPRSIWTTKPIGSGAYLAEKFNFGFTNLGCPIMAEFLIDFGYVGICAGGLFWGWLLNSLDQRHEIGSSRRRVLDVVYPFWLGMVFFISRGDLLSSLTYTFGITACAFPLILLSSPKEPETKNQLLTPSHIAN